MGNKKNIDRLFQEKFKDFEVFPEQDLWADINAKLDMASSGVADVAEKRRKAAPVFWWRLGGIAAAIALLLSLGLNFLFTDPADIPDDPIEKVAEDHNEPAEGGETSRDKDQVTEDNSSLVATDKSAEEDKTTAPSQPVKTHDRTSQQENNSQSTGTNSTSQTGEGRVVQQENDPKSTDDRANTGEQSTNTGIAEADPSSVENKTDIDKGNRLTQHGKEESKTTDPSQQKTGPQRDGRTDEKGEGPKKSLLEAIAEMENETDREEDLASKQGKEAGKWSINPNVAPVYYNSVSNGSPVDPQFKENSKSGKVNLSYGINVAYQVNKRVSVRSGISKVNYGYNTNDISFAPNFQARALDNINYTRQSEKSSGLYVSSNNTNPNINNSPPPLAAREDAASSFAPQDGLMLQEFGYIEVPMEVKYRVINKKLGLNLIGGVSSLFLTDNSVLLKSESLATEYGEANNVNDVNFSTNVGLGVDYLLSDKIQLQVEPMFKYQWNTFSNDNGGFRPYSFGVYTGFSFRF